MCHTLILSLLLATASSLALYSKLQLRFDPGHGTRLVDPDYTFVTSDVTRLIFAHDFTDEVDSTSTAADLESDFKEQLGGHHFQNFVDILVYLEVKNQYTLLESIFSKALLAGYLQKYNCPLASNGQCITGIGNINTVNAAIVFRDFLDEYYYDVIKTLYADGLLWDAHIRLDRLLRLIDKIDLPARSTGPLGTQGSDLYNKYLILRAFLGDPSTARNPALFRDAAYVNATFQIADEVDSKRYVPPPMEWPIEMRLLVTGLTNLASGCQQTAAHYFAELMEIQTSPHLHELATFLLLRSDFTASRSPRNIALEDALRSLEDAQRSLARQSVEDLEPTAGVQMPSLEYLEPTSGVLMPPEVNGSLRSMLTLPQAPSCETTATPATEIDWTLLRKSVFTPSLLTDVDEMHEFMTHKNKDLKE